VDGAGNFVLGARAAEQLLAWVRGWAWSRDTDPWDLQEVLMAADAEIQGSGGETTAVLAVFGGDGQLMAAAAGDTRILARVAGSDHVFPESGVARARLGSGSCAPAVWSGAVEGTTYVVTDGAWTRGISALERSLAEQGQGMQAWINGQGRSSGDDATTVCIHA
jgi:hypothetical protein